MNTEVLIQTVKEMMTSGKGLLAADESVNTAGKRLDDIGVESTEETRRKYRELFLGAEGIREYLSGVILYDETIRQKSDDGTPYAELLEKKGIIPGIKVDHSTIPFPGFPDEVLTAGLDGLPERLKEYKQMNARFTKWRVVVRIGDEIPTDVLIETNMSNLARYARVAQEAGLVPIVEPEVLLEGKHSFGKSEGITQRVLEELVRQLERYRVYLPGVILKTSMVLPGSESEEVVSAADIGQATVRVLKTALPEDLGGVVFLSGGQEAIEATENLSEVNKKDGTPWNMTFSYARALQGPALETWKGQEENVEDARAVFLHRLKMNSLAQKGEYESAMENDNH